MTTDNILPWAAKAIGIEECHGAYLVPHGMTTRTWNSETDDGDAFRLAVRLGLFSDPRIHHYYSIASSAMDMRPTEAWRYAFTATAAEMGKSA